MHPLRVANKIAEALVEKPAPLVSCQLAGMGQDVRTNGREDCPWEEKITAHSWRAIFPVSKTKPAAYFLLPVLSNSSRMARSSQGAVSQA
jgi:hypothetical protein